MEENTIVLLGNNISSHLMALYLSKKEKKTIIIGKEEKNNWKYDNFLWEEEYNMSWLAESGLQIKMQKWTNPCIATEESIYLHKSIVLLDIDDLQTQLHLILEEKNVMIIDGEYQSMKEDGKYQIIIKNSSGEFCLYTKHIIDCRNKSIGKDTYFYASYSAIIKGEHQRNTCTVMDLTINHSEDPYFPVTFGQLIPLDQETLLIRETTMVTSNTDHVFLKRRLNERKRRLRIDGEVVKEYFTLNEINHEITCPIDFTVLEENVIDNLHLLPSRMATWIAIPRVVDEIPETWTLWFYRYIFHYLIITMNKIHNPVVMYKLFEQVLRIDNNFLSIAVTHSISRIIFLMSYVAWKFLLILLKKI